MIRQSVPLIVALACAALLAWLAFSIAVDAFSSGAISQRVSRGGETWVLTRAAEPVGFYLFAVLHVLIGLFSSGFIVFVAVLYLRRR